MSLNRDSKWPWCTPTGTQRWPRDIRVQRTHLELGARSCGRRLRPELRRAGVRRAGRVGACEWRPGAAAEAEVERGWAAAGWGLTNGLALLCSQHPRANRNSQLQPDFAGCHEAIFIQVGECNMFYLTVCNLICNI